MNNTPATSRRHTPWIRIIFVLVYLGVLVCAGLYERAAYRIHDKAENLRASEKYGAAGIAFQIVIERYPLSFHAPHARAAFDSIAPASYRMGAPERLCETLLERTVSHQLSPYVVDQFPLVAWPCVVVLSFLVFVTRIPRRFGFSILAFLFLIPSAAVTVLFLGIAGGIPFDWAERIVVALEPVLAQPIIVYAATWAALGIAALLTLTPARRRVRPIPPNHASGAPPQQAAQAASDYKPPAVPARVSAAAQRPPTSACGGPPPRRAEPDIDDVLAKIRWGGIHALSDEERRRLAEACQAGRDQEH